MQTRRHHSASLGYNWIYWFGVTRKTDYNEIPWSIEKEAHILRLGGSWRIYVVIRLAGKTKHPRSEHARNMLCVNKRWFSNSKMNDWLGEQLKMSQCKAYRWLKESDRVSHSLCTNDLLRVQTIQPHTTLHLVDDALMQQRRCPWRRTFPCRMNIF